MEKYVVEDSSKSKQERDLEQLVRDWRDFLRSTALSVGEKQAFTIWDIQWIERHLELEKRSKKLLEE
jgi:hypothetical protein